MDIIENNVQDLKKFSKFFFVRWCGNMVIVFFLLCFCFAFLFFALMIILKQIQNLAPTHIKKNMCVHGKVYYHYLNYHHYDDDYGMYHNDNDHHHRQQSMSQTIRFTCRKYVYILLIYFLVVQFGFEYTKKYIL